MTGLSIENISMRFDLPSGGAVQALQDVSLHLNEGELLSVLGPSGCGKTTLLNIVAGFLAPTEGQITLNGKSATFTLPTDRPLVGIDFNPGFYANKLVFTLNGPDGAPLDGALIKTGSKSAAAPFPIVIEMVTPDS